VFWSWRMPANECCGKSSRNMECPISPSSDEVSKKTSAIKRMSPHRSHFLTVTPQRRFLPKIKGIKPYKHRDQNATNNEFNNYTDGDCSSAAARSCDRYASRDPQPALALAGVTVSELLPVQQHALNTTTAPAMKVIHPITGLHFYGIAASALLLLSTV